MVRHCLLWRRLIIVWIFSNKKYFNFTLYFRSIKLIILRFFRGKHKISQKRLHRKLISHNRMKKPNNSDHNLRMQSRIGRKKLPLKMIRIFSISVLRKKCNWLYIRDNNYWKRRKKRSKSYKKKKWKRWRHINIYFS